MDVCCKWDLKEERENENIISAYVELSDDGDKSFIDLLIDLDTGERIVLHNLNTKDLQSIKNICDKGIIYAREYIRITGTKGC